MEKFSEAVVPTKVVDAGKVAKLPLDRQSEKDASTNASGSTYDESKTSNGGAILDAQEETAPWEEPLEEVLDAKKKAIIVLALCVSLPLLFHCR